jgi:hypothetical protein
MKKQMWVLALSLSLIASVAGGAAGDFQTGPVLQDQTPSGWHLIQYFGDEEYAQLALQHQLGISTGVGLGCGFIGLGVGTLNPFAGLFVGVGCEAGLMA